MFKRVVLAFSLIVLVLIFTACSDSSGDTSKAEGKSNYPSESLEIIIPFGPGGGTDMMGRKVADILEKYELYPENIQVENKKGGSGAVGWGYLKNQEGNPYIATPTSMSFITTPLVSDTNWDYSSFTPIALLGTDNLLLLVPYDSKYETLEDFIKEAKSKQLSIGGVGAVSDEMIVPNLLGKEAGFDFKYVPFQGAGQLTSALTSGSVDAIVGNPARSMGQIEGKVMKPLAFAGEERLPILEDVPTFKELGYDVTVAQPRGIILAGDVSEGVRNWWIDTMKKVAEKPEWKKYLKQNGLSEYTLYGDEFGEYLKKTSDTFEGILKELGKIE
ncbi:tripartite tricarboxylate transporter substrate-binding protein [Virgibacillus siamensis]|uniref:Tripartite tricarboxylate transporter substrate-binding protein n=1 Tax=Virgibacillus siamensis TaxID=480071 RepID=A0ABP3RGX4_9BACI